MLIALAEFVSTFTVVKLEKMYCPFPDGLGARQTQYPVSQN